MMRRRRFEVLCAAFFQESGILFSDLYLVEHYNSAALFAAADARNYHLHKLDSLGERFFSRLD